mgnify:CR=1 FL=1
MKHVCITYHMTRPNEVAETCTTIAMTDDIAADLLEKQEDSDYVRIRSRFTLQPLPVLLNQLAALQGYDRATFCCAEEAKL